MKARFVFACVLSMAAAAAEQPVLSLSATADSPGAIKIDVLRWSTDAERDQMFAAWTQPGAGRGRGAASPAEDPFGGSNDAAPGRGAAAAGGRGGGRGGRGGNAAAEAAPRTPEGSLATALAGAPTVGYLWSAAEVSGYALRYAAKFAAADGSERVVLITDRRLGAWNDLWKSAGSPTKYDFSLIELRLKSKGAGEGKTSLSGSIAADAPGKTFTLDNYAGLPIMLKNVTRR
ncbi:MAG TPA: hypothetical protein VEV85_00420 [Bryobacteraceae bacterium]|nr:hypothetical protein [Bryobacteraceae bacterium]